MLNFLSYIYTKNTWTQRRLDFDNSVCSQYREKDQVFISVVGYVFTSFLPQLSKR